MKCIDEVIKKMQANVSRYDESFAIANLELANKLCEICKAAEDLCYLDKIVQTFCEVLETQQEIIRDLKMEIDRLETRESQITTVGMHTNHLPALQSAVVAEKKETEVPFELPEGGVFKNSNQVKEAFIAYLKGIIKNGKPLSHTTVFDYSSRINMLFTYFKKERDAGKLEGEIQIEAEKIIDNGSYLSVYNNLELFDAYVREKEREIKQREAEKRPFSAEELAFNPLNSYKNLRNSYASLRKFREFKDKVDEIVKARGEM
jgi:hypothetical protein